MVFRPKWRWKNDHDENDFISHSTDFGGNFSLWQISES